ncbi:hypothetical protein BJF78_29215 [Pseudonocardia sp. CNS-139]|nr:hypothetical protein BJF78_29215 [Pseudonocardia sp. CNS-139]
MRGRPAFPGAVAEHHVDLFGLVEPHGDLDREQMPEVDHRLARVLHRADHAHTERTALACERLQRHLRAGLEPLVGLVGDDVGQLVDDQEHERHAGLRRPLRHLPVPEPLGPLTGEGRDVFEQLHGGLVVAVDELGEQLGRAAKFHAAFGVDTEDLHVSGADGRGEVPQRRPYRRGLARAGRADDEHMSAGEPDPPGRPVSSVPSTTRRRSTTVEVSGSSGAGRGAARGSRCRKSSQMRRGLSTRIRQAIAPNACASVSARRA